MQKFHLFLKLLFGSIFLIFSHPSCPQSQSKDAENYIDEKSEALELLMDCVVRWENGIHYRHHYKRKILRDNYGEAANIKIKYFAFKSLESIRDLKAVIYTPKGDGTFQKKELAPENIIEVNLDNKYRQVNLLFPKVQKGAILEWKYTISSYSFLGIGPWHFSSVYPIKKSSFAVNIYSIPWHIMLRGKELLEKYQGDEGRLLYRWEMENIKAQNQNIPFLDNVQNYSNSVTLHQGRLQAVSRKKKGNSNHFTNSPIDTLWLPQQLNTIVTDIFMAGESPKYKNESHAYKKYFETHFPDSIAGDALKIIDWYKNEFKWNNSYSYSASQPLRSFLKKKSGNDTEMALGLFGFLKSQGFESEMILSAPTQHIKIQPEYPFLPNFSAMFLRLKLNEEWTYIDPCQPHLPPGFINPNYLENAAICCSETPWIIESLSDKGRSQVLWNIVLDLKATQPKYQIKLRANGHKMQEIIPQPKRYIARRLNIQPENIEQFSIVKNEKGIQIECYAAYDSEGESTLAVLPFKSFTKNPFASDKERIYPIDLGYPASEKIIFNVLFPKTIVPLSSPDEQKYLLPNKMGGFTLKSAYMGNALTTISHFYNNQRFLPAEFFPILRQLSEDLMALQEQVILLKNNPNKQ
ncbi:DUF3857 domain-containing protein [Persicobacter diffluens]|uniref:DUF3857 domain-containing protein n=1 Tax=Persicobacter diffluens TaxID=981 RepID=A0AAN4VYA1_9BACT|nr:hypothetical protein PEDI_15870 [Persicobacter diffluens]